MNRYKHKKQSLIQKYPRGFSIITAVFGAGLLLSKPIYDSFTQQPMTIEQLREQIKQDPTYIRNKKKTDQ